jgi:predicted MPP superfamily phosphohydrolase
MAIPRRAQDRPEYGRGAISRRSVLKALVAAGVGAASGVGAYGFLYERRGLELTRATLSVTGLSPALDGLRIGLLTDVHHSRWVSHEEVVGAVGALMHERPDLIILGGDYVTWGGDRVKRGDRGYVQPAAEALGTLAAPHGVFGILGNHDDDHDMPAALRKHGVQVLRDARTRIGVRHEHVELAGIRFWTKRVSDIASIVRGASAPVILLAHDPRRLMEAEALKIPLVLSGHTHGGQVVLPGAGAIAARKFPVVAGIGRRGATSIFVSRGMGTVYVPVRINCPPEIAVLTLQSAPETPVPRASRARV